MTSRLQKAFDKFDAANPHVYDLVDHFTRKAIEAGFKHYAVATIIERVRWHTSVETKSDDNFKIANAHAAYYARKWMRLNPEHQGFFRTAELRALDGVEDDEEGDRPDPHAAMRIFFGWSE